MAPNLDDLHEFDMHISLNSLNILLLCSQLLSFVVEILDPPFSECLIKGKECVQHFKPKTSNFHYCFVGKKPCQQPGVPLSTIKRYLWRKKDGPFGKEIPVPDGNSGYSSLTGSRQREAERWTNVGGLIPTGGRPIYSSSQVPISRINNQGVVKRIRKSAYSQTNPDAEESNDFDAEEVEVIDPLVGHYSSSSPSQPPFKKFHSHIIPSTPKSFQPVPSSLPYSTPPPSPKPSASSLFLASPMKPCPIPQPRTSPILTSHKS
ncbi:hypothetical protein O181_054961 [Austropuccinia psidii MF-1]|uniref:Uncharacterized protein n=1 Tax=Austropuccinia psidii MF-1 TaxID=1389203 RepID=A0A9Q3HRM3_9BASI|nr:hypothetical protein [Austropuccinia psidii MF-1]